MHTLTLLDGCLNPTPLTGFTFRHDGLLVGVNLHVTGVGQRHAQQDRGQPS